MTRTERIRAFTAARLDRTGYLGLHLTVCLVVAMLGAFALGSLIHAVLANQAMIRWDLAAERWVQARATPAGHRVCQYVSDLGSPNTMAWLGVLGAIALWVLRRRVLLVGWVAAFAGAQVLAPILKVAVHRNRPGAHSALGDYSFPSSHAMASIVGLGVLAYAAAQVWRPSRAWQYMMAMAAAVLAGAIGVSRVYLGMHYVSDVVGGYAAGIAWAAVCVAATGVALHHSRG